MMIWIILKTVDMVRTAQFLGIFQVDVTEFLMIWVWSVREESSLTPFSPPKQLVEWNDGQLIWGDAVVGVGYIGRRGDQEVSSGHTELRCLFDAHVS